MRHFIEGLAEAYDRERRIREEVYLDLPAYVCGIPLRQITPRIFALLLHIRTPFIGGGEVTPAAIGQFLWACHRDYEPPKRNWRGKVTNKARDRFLASLGGNWDQLETGIEEFLDDTFLDMPQGSSKGEQTPYVCGVAWMEYRMLREPFLWTSERTLDTPLRRIYQLMRCDDAAHGTPLFNRFSDGVKDKFLRDLDVKNRRESVRERVIANITASRAAREACKLGRN